MLCCKAVLSGVRSAASIMIVQHVTDNSVDSPPRHVFMTPSKRALITSVQFHTEVEDSSTRSIHM